MTDLDKFNDEKKFPKPEDIRIIQMLENGDLQVSILSSDKNLHLHGSTTCPKGTAMHKWLLTLSGPLVPRSNDVLPNRTPE